jgi:hypothetical protein
MRLPSIGQSETSAAAAERKPIGEFAAGNSVPGQGAPTKTSIGSG